MKKNVFLFFVFVGGGGERLADSHQRRGRDICNVGYIYIYTIFRKVAVFVPSRSIIMAVSTAQGTRCFYVLPSGWARALDVVDTIIYV